MYVCVCVYVCTDACTVCVHVHVCMYACMLVCSIYVRVYASVYVFTYILYVCMHACTYACTYVCMYVIYLRMYVCLYVTRYVQIGKRALILGRDRNVLSGCADGLLTYRASSSGSPYPSYIDRSVKLTSDVNLVTKLRMHDSVKLPLLYRWAY